VCEKSYLREYARKAPMDSPRFVGLKTAVRHRNGSQEACFTVAEDMHQCDEYAFPWTSRGDIDVPQYKSDNNILDQL